MSSIVTVSQLSPDRRFEFIRQTYTHVIGSFGCLAFLSWVLFNSGFGEWFYNLINVYAFSWLIVLGGFTLLGRISSFYAEKVDRGSQYLGLGISIIAESLIFAPLIYAVYENAGSNAITSAVIGTIVMVGALTAVVGASKSDFSYLDGVLKVLGWISLAFIITSVMFGFSLGTLFSYAMIGLAGGYIVYDTSRILNDQSEDNYVAAALELFSSIALLLWYLMTIFGDDEDD